jgi:hypothetical protein
VGVGEGFVRVVLRDERRSRGVEVREVLLRRPVLELAGRVEERAGVVEACGRSRDR